MENGLLVLWLFLITIESEEFVEQVIHLVHELVDRAAPAPSLEFDHGVSTLTYCR